MTFSTQFLLNAVSLTGGCCAISLPVVLNSIGGGGDSALISPTSLQPCGDNAKEGFQEVNYGDKGIREVCGYANNIIQSPKEGGMDEEYTKLFKEKWGQTASESRDGSFDSQSQGMQQCEGIQSPGGIFNSTGGIEYFGLCKKDEQSKTSFVKKEKIDSGNKKTLKLWICDGDCGAENATEIGGTKFLQQEKKDNWKEVSFRRKK